MKIELNLAPSDVSMILAYEMAKTTKPLPGDLKEADVRRIVEKHYFSVSSSRAPYWGEGLRMERQKEIQEWASAIALRFV